MMDDMRTKPLETKSVEAEEPLENSKGISKDKKRKRASRKQISSELRLEAQGSYNQSLDRVSASNNDDISAEIRRRNLEIFAAKVEDGEPVKEIARRYGLSPGAVYGILRQFLTDHKREPRLCEECIDEFEDNLIGQREIALAIARGKCLKHYQREYRSKNKHKLLQRDFEEVPLLDSHGKIVGITTVRERRLAAHREAQKRYCERHPERIRSILQRYRTSDRGKLANQRAVQNYREKKRQTRLDELLEEYKGGTYVIGSRIDQILHAHEEGADIIGSRIDQMLRAHNQNEDTIKSGKG